MNWNAAKVGSICDCAQKSGYAAYMDLSPINQSVLDSTNYKQIYFLKQSVDQQSCHLISYDDTPQIYKYVAPPILKECGLITSDGNYRKPVT